MYITYNNKDYPCKCKVGSTMVYSGLPEDFPRSVSGEIVLKANDGFVLRTDKTEDYLYQKYENGTLTLTNTHEPEPIEPEQIESTEITTDDMARAIMEGVNEV